MFRPNRGYQYDPAYIPKVSSNELQDLLKASYQRNTPAREIGKKYGYALDDSLSNAEQKVYIDKEGRPKIVFTGTRKFGDYLTDAALAVGLAGMTPRFQKARELVEKVKQKYKNKPISSYGHSLGGSLAESVADKVDKVITYNKGTGLFGVGKKINPKETDIRTSNDYISLLGKTQRGNKVNVSNPKEFGLYGSHDISNLSRINKIF